MPGRAGGARGDPVRGRSSAAAASRCSTPCLRCIQHSADRIYAIGNPPDYEPTPDQTVAAIAERRGEDPLATMYDLMLESDASALLMLPFYNYAAGNHDASTRC